MPLGPGVKLGPYCPQLLPGGNALLFTATSEDIATIDDARIEVQRLDSGNGRRRCSAATVAATSRRAT